MQKIKKLVSAALLYVFVLDTALFAQIRPLPPRDQASAGPWVRVSGHPPVSSSGMPHSSPTSMPSSSDQAPTLPAADAPTPIDLSSWRAEGNPTDGTWDVSSDGLAVVQTQKANPTFFVSPESHANTTLRGRVKVLDPSGSDSLGFVVGYRAPIAGNGDAPGQHDYLLLDWRGAAKTQGTFTAEAGIALSRVRGTVAAGSPLFFRHETGPVLQVLKSELGSGKGWVPGREYAFEVSYRSSRVRLTVDGKEVLNVIGAFPEGRLGFYTYAQGGVRFSDLALQSGNGAPVADAGPDQTVSCGPACTAGVTLDGSRSSDPDGDVLTYTWSGPFGSAQGATPNVALPRGVNTLTLTVDDGNGATAEDTVDVTVRDTTSPVIACPSDLQITTSAGQCQATGVSLGSATATDDCGVASITNDAPAVFPHGSTHVAWGASDPSANLATCVQVVSVDDHTPPVVTASVAQAALWPPNHSMIDVGLQTTAVDTCGDQPAVSVSVWSDEPNDDTGDGDTSPDAAVDAGKLFLRAERKGNADGRVYLALVSGSDPAENVGTACTTVVVPHSQSKSDKASVAAQAQAAQAYCAANQAAPSGFYLLAQGTLAAPNRPPVVNAGPDQTLVLPTVTASLNGSAVDDGLPTGSTLHVSWSVVGTAPGNVIFANSSQAITTATFDAPGTYILRLSATDGQLSASDDVQITLVSPNAPPVVDAGPAKTLVLPTDTVSLSGIVTDDGLPNPPGAVTVRWTGPSGVVFLDPASPATTAVFNGAGTFVLTLTASDSVLSASSTVTITVKPPNQPPVVDAGHARTVVLPATSATLAGSATDDGLPTGSTLALSWTEVSGPGAVSFGDPSAATTAATFGATGLYVLRLTATDGEMTSSSDVVVTVAEANLPPSVDAGPNRAITLPTNSVALAGSATDDGLPLGGALATSWTQASGDGTAAFASPSVPQTTATFSAEGTYVLSLTASDGALSSSSTVSITVNPAGTPNQPPVVSAGPELTITLPQNGAVLAGSATDDGLPEGNTLSAQWSQVSGPPGVTFTAPTTPSTGATFPAAGSYDLRLTASDGALSSSADVIVTVNPPGFGNQAPVVDAGPDQSLLTPVNTASLAGSVTDDGLPSGTVTLSWTKASGPGNVFFSQFASLQTDATFDAPGVYVLQLTATDGALYSSDTVKVTVRPFTIALDPPAAGPNVVGASQTMRATVRDGDGIAVSGVLVDFAVAGPNATSGSAVTDDTGVAVLAYTGNSVGTDTVTATASAGGAVETSNTAAVYWLVPTQPVSTTTINARFFAVPNGSRFSAKPTDTPVFTMNVPTINFNPIAGTVPGNTSNVTEWTRPFTDVITDNNGNFTGTIVAQGNGLQAGLPTSCCDPLYDFNAVFEGTLTVAAAGSITFNFLSDDGFIFGVGNGATRVSGVLTNPPTSGKTAFDGYPVLGAFDTPTAPTPNSVTVNFPAPGSYPYEIDYNECNGLQLALTLTTAASGNHGIPPSGALTLSPNTLPQQTVGQQVTFTVKAVDASGAALASLPVTLLLSGTNAPFQLTGTTDSNGQATFAYAGGQSGTDQVQAQAPLTGMRAYSNVVVVQWQGAANKAPVVSAGPNRTITLPDGAALDASATDDGLPFGSALTVRWTKVSGPGNVTFAAPNAIDTTATFSAAGSYVLRLTANDTQLTASSDVTITVNPQGVNQPPVVSAGASQTITLPTNTVALTGSATDDGLPSGSILAVGWSKVSGPGSVTFADASAAASAVRFGAAGSYTLRLTASDGQYTVASDVGVTVNPPPTPNQPPVVSAGPNQVLPPATTNTTLSGSVTDDGLPSGSPLTASWTLVSGPGTVAFGSPASPVTSAVFSTTGTYDLRLTATDGQYVSSGDLFVTLPGNQAPVVSAGANQTITLPTSTATLSGSITDDGLPGGALTSSWSVVSGAGSVAFASPTTAATTVTFDAPGLYVLRLTASDGALKSTSDVSVVLKGAASQGPPLSLAPSSPVDGAHITTPTPVIGTVAAPAGTSLFNWKLEHRRKGGTAWTRFAFGTTPVTNGVLGTLDPTMMLNGVYDVRLTATDTAARSVSTSVSVVVRDNMKVGPFTVSFVDLEVPVAGLPIRVTRTYDSRDGDVGDFGFGWRLDLSSVRLSKSGFLEDGYQATTSGTFIQYCLAETRPHVVTLTFPDGKVQEFQQVLSPQCQLGPISTVAVSYQPVPGSATLGTLSIPGGATAEVDASWPGTAFLTTDGFNAFEPTTFQYTAPDGRSFVVDANQGLKSLRDLSGNVLTVTAGGITHSSGIGVVFQRDAQGRITSITDPNQHALNYAYDSSGDLQTFTDREDNATEFTYSEAHPHNLESILDPLGRTPIRNEYYDDGRIKSHTDAFQKTITYAHDVANRQEVVTDRLGGTRVLSYDERGNVVREIDANGKQVDRTFDARSNRTSETLPHDPAAVNPPKSVYVYDGQDNLLSTTDPESHTTAYTYDSRKHVLTTTDPREKVTVNAYDSATGNLLSTLDAAGNRTAYTYFADGSVKTQTVTVGGVDQTTQYEYVQGRLTQETDSLGHATSYTYDANGNRLTQQTTRTAASGPETLTTTYVYDKQGRLTETHDPDGSVSFTTYDPLGKAQETKDKLGHRTTYTYDDMGRLTVTAYEDGSTDETTYDAEGRRKTSKDRDGRVTTYEYDPVGRLVKTTFPDLSFTQSVYDDAGRLTQTIDARGKSTFYEYDNAGRRTKVRVQTAPATFAETNFTYDASGNQSTVKDPKGTVTTFVYDALSRRVQTIFPDQTTTLTAYDALGRRVGETDQAGRKTSFDYDALGRLTRVVDPLQHETRYAYDEVGNRISQTDANTHTTSFEYDKLGRETKRTLPGGKFETKTYDAQGNLKTRTDFGGQTTNYDYDGNNRLQTRSYPDASSVAFTYFPTGKRQTVTDARGLTGYTYDVRGHLASLVYPDGRELDYGYDANGNRTSLEAHVAGQVLATSFAYDDASRLQTVTDPLQRPYTLGYDPNGNRASLAYPNGVATAYTYSTLNRLTTLVTQGPSQLIQSYAFTLGPTGNRTRIDEGDGSIRQYTYDDLYRLTGETVFRSANLLDYSKAFTYDAVGNRQTQATTGAGSPGSPTAPGSVAYAYDTRDRLTTENATPLTYDDNGNLTSQATGGATYTWDFENRLTKVTKTNGTIVAYVYDADGNRVQTTTTLPGQATQTTNYLVDTSGSLSQVVAEIDASGALQAYYVRAGDDLVSVMRPSSGSWTTRFYHADGLGSVRRLTDENGLITDGYTYDAFGELLAHTGSDPQPYAFTGEPLDPNSGFQYHRARWMDPRVGRFGAGDRVYGIADEPGTLHRYLYAMGNPVNRSDPSGLLSNFLYGRRVHEIIGADFVSENPGGRDSDLGINAILDDVIPYLGRLRPDLIDYDLKQIYEIKTVRGYTIGVLQLQGYLLALNWADPDKTHPWTPGLGYLPPKAFPVGPLATAVTFPPLGGVITYEVFDALPIVLGLAALAAESATSMMAEVGAQALTAISLNTLAPVG